MNWELYEVWSVDEDGHEELIDTTQSLKEARLLAEQSLTEYYAECIIYKALTIEPLKGLITFFISKIYKKDQI